MENIINLRDQLEIEINREVEFQFKKALRECETLGELRNFEPERLSPQISNSFNGFNKSELRFSILSGDISDAINSEIKYRFREKVDNFINNTGVNLK
ncbi:hypothetical protein [Mammaliicoccus sciuri]|uniref:hypothetical protein n=1 Tax=Mammaliicoccus sciuri TaxID=1296 RepID=UPI0021D2AFAA|nr:hypothetical protein [Mammaliicoccus sciuri]UXV31909.1 hypothetical protein MUA60_13350 [Mammaliicoccus sciuri]